MRFGAFLYILASFLPLAGPVLRAAADVQVVNLFSPANNRIVPFRVYTPPASPIGKRATAVREWASPIREWPTPVGECASPIGEWPTSTGEWRWPIGEQSSPTRNGPWPIAESA
jgi:hypothetical protein